MAPEKLELADREVEHGAVCTSPDKEDGKHEEVYVIDPQAERKLVRKLDWILLPLFTLICECQRPNLLRHVYIERVCLRTA